MKPALCASKRKPPPGGVVARADESWAGSYMAALARREAAWLSAWRASAS